MLVFVKESLIIYSMPKTGTTSIDQALANRSTIRFSGTRNGGLKHISPSGFRKWEKALEKQYPDKKFESCCVMREPIEWLGSWYRYRTRDALKNNPRYLGNITFNQFVKNICNGKGVKPQSKNLFNFQSRFLTRENKLIINRIFPYDKFQLFISYLNNKFNTEINVPQTNVSPVSKSNELELESDTSEKLQQLISLDSNIYKKLMELDSYESSNQNHVNAFEGIINKNTKA